MILYIILALIVILLAISIVLLFYVLHNSPEPEKRQKPEDYAVSPLFEKYAPRFLALKDNVESLPWERCYIKSKDGLKLSARLYLKDNNAPFVVFMHGYRACAIGDFAGVCEPYLKLGWNILLADERACGESEGSFVTFGAKERMDCIGWVKYLISRFGPDSRVLLSGMSMGAATILMASNKAPRNVIGIIADCGFTSAAEELKCSCKKMKLPADLCYALLRFSAGIIGVDLDGADAAAALRSSSIPVCLIHGYIDSIVPYRMCGDLYSAACVKRSAGVTAKMYTFNDADHAGSCYCEPERYSGIVEEFAEFCVDNTLT